MTLSTISDYFLGGGSASGRKRGAVERFIDEFDVPDDLSAPMGTLSGGNQQKVVVARWFARQPRLFLMHEPTQGVDVGARRGLFAKIRDIADTGVPSCWRAPNTRIWPASVTGSSSSAMAGWSASFMAQP